MTTNKEATRYYSARQESYWADFIGGKVVAGSGSCKFTAGDCQTDDWIFECKTPMTPKKSISIKYDWIKQNELERMSLMKPYSAVVFNFEPDGKNYVVLDEDIFKKMYENFK